MKSIFLAVLHQGSLSTELAFRLPLIAQDERFKVKVVQYGHKPISQNRNKIVKDFLEKDYDYLAMVDSDTIPPTNILDLVLLDKDIIGGVCPQWREGDLYWVVMKEVAGGYKQVILKDRGGLKEVDAIGTGCIIIRRNVLENIDIPFERKWVYGFQEIGLDFYFCKKAREKGFKVYAHWDYLCGHKKELDLLNVMQLLSRGK